MKLLKALLWKAGWELRRVPPTHPPPASVRSTMREGLRWLAKQDLEIATVLDVGASNGCWSRQCMEFFPRCQYVLLEPQSVHQAALTSFQGEQQRGVIVVPMPVGEQCGRVWFKADHAFGGALDLEHASTDSTQMEMTTLDAVTQEHQLESPFLIKLDTHGFEREILEGGKDVLQSAQALIVETYFYRLQKKTLLFWELCEYLATRGFRPVDWVDSLYRPHDHAFWQADIIFVRESWPGFGYSSYGS